MRGKMKIAFALGVVVLLVWFFWFYLPERLRDFWFGREDSELARKRDMMKQFREVLKQYKEKLPFLTYWRMWACGGNVGSPLSAAEFELVALGDVSPLQKYFKGVKQ